MCLGSGCHQRHSGTDTVNMEADDATLTERKLRQHQGEHEDHADR